MKSLEGATPEEGGGGWRGGLAAEDWLRILLGRLDSKAEMETYVS